MRALLQRVRQASVSVDDERIGDIGSGLLVFLGLEPEDSFAVGARLLERIVNYRVFADEEQRMNRSLRDVSGGLLLVSQFTLAADTSRGLRPGFSTAMPPVQAEPLFNELFAHAESHYPQTAGGRFGANMQISLINDGPVTFMLHAA